MKAAASLSAVTLVMTKAGTAPEAAAPPWSVIGCWPCRRWLVGLDGGRGVELPS